MPFDRSAIGGNFPECMTEVFSLSLVFAAKLSKKKHNSILVNNNNFVDFRPPRQLRQAQVVAETVPETKELNVLQG